MTLSQVAEAVLVGREQQSIDPGDQFRDVHNLLELCSSFVCLVREPPLGSLSKRIDREQIASDAYLVLRLAHSSVKEYILSDRTNIASLGMHRLTSGIAQRFMAEACLIHLHQLDGESSISDENLQRHQFLLYAAKQWYHHYHDMPTEEEDNVVDLLLSFINTYYYGYAYRNWLNWLTGYTQLYHVIAQRWPPLAALSFRGCHRVVRAIVKNAAEVHVTKNIIRESLHCASLEGSKAVVRELLDAGARLDRTGVIDASSLRWALREATWRGKTEVSELLISRGAIAERLDYSFVSRVAARQGKLHMVKLFLDCCTTDCNNMDLFYITLQAAMNARQCSIVRYLLERSAELDITARDDLYFPTLLRAFFGRDDSTVQSLISRAFGPKAMSIRGAKLKVLDTSWTPRTKLVLLQILGAGTEHPLLERNHERDYVPAEDAYWENAVGVEDTIKETLLQEWKLLEEEELTEKAMDLLQQIRSLYTVASPAIETGSDGRV